MLLGLIAAVQPGLQTGAADPRVGAWQGAWTLSAAQATIDPPNKLVIAPMQGGVHVTMSGETHLDFAAQWNVHATTAPGNLGFNQVELHAVDKRQAEVKEKKDGVLMATVREKLSKDATELTTTTSMVGKPDKVTVWARTGGAKVGSDLFAGEWTQDMSKTRMRQGLTLRIEADGSGGVRFAGEFSFTARFDGKPYDLKNARNDSVALQMVDARTVDAVYRRDGQVTQKDRWQVSGDGQQMMLTSTGTLETGQHFTESLTFKRQ